MASNISLVENTHGNLIKKQHDTLLWANKLTIDYNDITPSNPEGGIHYHSIDEQILVTNDNTSRYFHIVRMPINIQGVGECSSVYIDINPVYEEVLLHSVLIIRDGKFCDKINSAEINTLRRELRAESKVFTGDITISIILPDIKEHDIVDISYTIINRNREEAALFSRLHILNYSVPITEKRFIVISQNELQYQFIKCDDKLEVSKFNDFISYSYHKKNVSAYRVKPYEPSWYFHAPMLQIGTGFTWKTLSEKMKDIFSIKPVDHPKIKWLTDELNEYADSFERLFIKLIIFINKNIRYFSNSSAAEYIRPASPDVILVRGYGDCKDIVNLVHYVLSHFGFTSHAVLVHTRLGKGIHTLHPSMRAFDHAIITIKHNNELFFYDPTTRQEVTKLENLYLYDFGWGLICDGNSETLVKIENTHSINNSIKVVDNYQCISWLKNEYIFSVNLILKGGPALSSRDNIASQTARKMLDNQKDYYARFMKIHEEISAEIVNESAIDNFIEYRLSYKIACKYFREEEFKHTLELMPYDIYEQLLLDLPDNLDSDFYYGGPIAIDYIIDIKNICTHELRKNPEPLTSKYLSINREFIEEKGGIRYIYKFTKHGVVVDYKDIENFKNEQENVFKMLVARVSIYKDSKISSSNPFSIKLMTIVKIAIIFVIYKLVHQN